MRRRVLLASAALLAVPTRALAQVTHRPVRIGVLSSTSPEARSRFWNAFKDGMTKLGWVEGRDISYVFRYTRGDQSKFHALAVELVAEKPDLLFAGTQVAAEALRRATRTIPIVFAFVGDPVTSGLVASFARPGGNATGLTGVGPDLLAKLVELLHEIAPKANHLTAVIGINLEEMQLAAVQSAAKKLGLVITVARVKEAAAAEKLVQAFEAKPPEAVLFVYTPVLMRDVLMERMTKLRVPAVYTVPLMVEAGGLASYGADLADNFRRAAEYADRILRGAKPADLPVQQPTKFELAVNLKTARAQGITIPQTVLLRATRIIE